jgi:hypothetical protein
MRTGIVAEFEEAGRLADAISRLRELGYRHLDAFMPYPVDDVLERLPHPRSRIAPIMLAAGLTGACFGYVVQWFCNAYDFPIDVGGRPLHSAPAWIPITFESAVLFASVTGFVAMMAIARLPRLWDPVFEVAGFDRASVDTFWIAVDETDPRFDWSIADELRRLGARRVAGLRREP